MKTGKNLPMNPISIKIRFAVKFLQAMKKLNKKRSPSASMANKYKRYLVIRTAACVSMASAVGPTRAWSRALLKNIRNHTPHHFPMNKRTNIFTRRSKRVLIRQDLLGFGQEDHLRRLVPGGEGMGFGRLLSESAHYIKCLRDQVQVMRSMLDHYST